MKNHIRNDVQSAELSRELSQTRHYLNTSVVQYRVDLRITHINNRHPKENYIAYKCARPVPYRKRFIIKKMYKSTESLSKLY